MTYSYNRRRASDDETSDVDDAEYSSVDDLKEMAKYVKRCAVLVTLYQRIAEALETPKIATLAERIQKRIADVEALAVLIRKAIPLYAQVEKELEAECRAIAAGKPIRHGLIELVVDLPSARALRGLSREMEVISKGILQEDRRESYLDWNLEEYIGYETRVYKRIESAAPGSFDNVDVWAERVPYSLLRYFADAEYIQGLIEEYRSEAA